LYKTLSVIPGYSFYNQALDTSAHLLILFKVPKENKNVYQRAGSLNIINDVIGLNFSCDESGYMPFDEFLEKSTDFWFGSIA